jgi:hypothetical protein
MSNQLNVSQLIEAVCTTAGDTAPELRRAVKARSSGHADGAKPENLVTIPLELETYVDKVSNHAFKVMDEDINALLQAGYSEDAVFEITLSAALGAGIGRLDQGLNALKGANHAIEKS